MCVSFEGMDSFLVLIMFVSSVSGEDLLLVLGIAIWIEGEADWGDCWI
jgi:hypothetical protein